MLIKWFSRLAFIAVLSASTHTTSAQVLAPDWSPILAASDGTASQRQQIHQLIQLHDNAIARGDAQTLHSILYFPTDADRDSFSRAAANALAGLRAAIPAGDAALPVTVEIISGPGDGSSGVYIVTSRRGQGDSRRDLREYTITVLGGRPMVTYDRYKYLGISRFDPVINPPVEIITQWGAKKTIEAPPLNMTDIDIAAAERDFNIWRDADQPALERYLKYAIDKSRSQIAALEHLAGRDEFEPRVIEQTALRLREHHAQIRELTHRALRERAMRALESRL